jgi:phospholipase A1
MLSAAAVFPVARSLVMSAHHRILFWPLLAAAISLPMGMAAPARGEEQPPALRDTCLLQALKNAAPETTVGELMVLCGQQPNGQEQNQETAGANGETQESDTAEPVVSAIDERFEEERKTRENVFVITPHKPNYVLPLAYKVPNNEPYLSTGGEYNDKIEVKFQFSFKYLVLANLLRRHGELYFAYTNQSYWQAYSSYKSSPFRETNHEPEVFVALPNSWEIFGFTNKLNILGASHQSNGRGGMESRSWNRVYTAFVFERDRFSFSIKPWLRLPEDAENDDNPDIEDYLGYGEFRAFYKYRAHVFGLMLRNNFDFSDNHGAVQLDWSFPLFHRERLKGYIQYFNGYGESLIDYNASTNRIGVGLLLTDWL